MSFKDTSVQILIATAYCIIFVSFFIFIQHSLTSFFNVKSNNVPKYKSYLTPQQSEYESQINNCPVLAQYYVAEIVEKTGQSFQVETEHARKQITVECTYNFDLFNKQSSKKYRTDKFTDYYAFNKNNYILIYIPNKENIDKPIPDKVLYGLLVHEVTHSFQYLHYKQPITAVLPEWYMEGQAEYERYSQLRQLNEKAFIIKQKEERDEYEEYFITFYNYSRIIGKERLYKLPLLLTDGVSFQELL